MTDWLEPAKRHLSKKLANFELVLIVPSSKTKEMLAPRVQKQKADNKHLNGPKKQ